MFSGRTSYTCHNIKKIFAFHLKHYHWEKILAASDPTFSVNDCLFEQYPHARCCYIVVQNRNRRWKKNNKDMFQL